MSDVSRAMFRSIGHFMTFPQPAPGSHFSRVSGKPVRV